MDIVVVGVAYRIPVAVDNTMDIEDIEDVVAIVAGDTVEDYVEEECVVEGDTVGVVVEEECVVEEDTVVVVEEEFVGDYDVDRHDLEEFAIPAIVEMSSEAFLVGEFRSVDYHWVVNSSWAVDSNCLVGEALKRNDPF